MFSPLQFYWLNICHSLSWDQPGATKPYFPQQTTATVPGRDCLGWSFQKHVNHPSIAQLFVLLSCNFSRKIKLIRKLHLAPMLLVWKWPTKLQAVFPPLLSFPPHSQSKSLIWSSLTRCCLELSCCSSCTFLLCLETVDKRSWNIYVGHLSVCQYCHVSTVAKFCLFLLFWYMVGYCRALASVLLQMLELFHSSSQSHLLQLWHYSWLSLNLISCVYLLWEEGSAVQRAYCDTAHTANCAAEVGQKSFHESDFSSLCCWKGGCLGCCSLEDCPTSSWYK